MTDTTAPTDAAEPLSARLRVEPHESAGCAVLSAGERGDDVVRTGGTSASDDCDCRAAVTVEVDGGESREFVQGTVDEHCVCPAFQEVECAAEIAGFASGALVVEVTVPDREALRDLVAALRNRAATVHLERVLPPNVGEESDDLRIDAATITAKQREAIAVAVDRGYYERPRGADLDAVADALGISRSAASQRLNAAETTLIQALVASTDIEQADVPRNDERDGVRGDGRNEDDDATERDTQDRRHPSTDTVGPTEEPIAE